ncbi:MAG: hypothetical protein AAFZ65_12615 [Planctomycetota bacterium]
MSDLVSTSVPSARSFALPRLRSALERSALPLGVLALIASTPLVGAFGLPVLAAAAWYGLKRVS